MAQKQKNNDIISLQKDYFSTCGENIQHLLSKLQRERVRERRKCELRPCDKNDGLFEVIFEKASVPKKIGTIRN